MQVLLRDLHAPATSNAARLEFPDDLLHHCPSMNIDAGDYYERPSAAAPDVVLMHTVPTFRAADGDPYIKIIDGVIVPETLVLDAKVHVL